MKLYTINKCEKFKYECREKSRKARIIFINVVVRKKFRQNRIIINDEDLKVILSCDFSNTCHFAILCFIEDDIDNLTLYFKCITRTT